MHDLFAGPHGLRAGWGILLFVFFWQLLHYALFPIVHSMLPAVAPGASGMDGVRTLALEVTSLFCVVVSTLVLARLEGRSFSDYGLSDDRRFRHLAGGAVCGAAILSALVLSLRAAGALVLDKRQLFGWSALGFAVLWLTVFIVVGFFEEMLFRGYVQFALTRGIAGLCEHFGMQQNRRLGFALAALLTSLYFGYTHGANTNESPVGLLSAGLIALVFCFSIWRTGSLWWAIGFHTMWDWVQSFIFGAGDSGGMIRGHLLTAGPMGNPILSGGVTGPEGSILTLPFIAVAALAVAVTTRGGEAAPPVTALEPTEPPAPASGLSLH